MQNKPLTFEEALTRSVSFRPSYNTAYFRKKRQTQKEVLKREIVNFLQGELAGIYIFTPQSVGIDDLFKLLTTTMFDNNIFFYVLKVQYDDLSIDYYTLSNNVLNEIRDILTRGLIIQENTSAEGLIADRYQIINLSLIKRLRTVPRIPTGAFLPYELTKYVQNQKDDNFQVLRNAWLRYTNNDENCLVHSVKLAIQEGKIPQHALEKLIEYKIENPRFHFIRNKDIQYLCNQMMINIHLRTFNENTEDIHIKIFIPSGISALNELQTLKLVLFHEHYFLDEDTEFNRFSIETGYRKAEANAILNEIYKKPNRKVPWFIRNTIYKAKTQKYGVYNLSAKLDSLQFLRAMLKNEELVEPMSEEKQINYRDLKYDANWLSNITSGYKSSEPENKKAQNPFSFHIKGDTPPKYNRIFFDFETHIHKKVSQQHQYDMLVTEYENQYKAYYSTDATSAAHQLLSEIYNGTYGDGNCFLLIAHNLAYDIQAFMKHPKFKILNRLALRDSKVKTVMATYYGKYLYFKDSLCVIPFKLDDFKEYLGLPGDYKKGACPYGYFNKNTINYQWALIDQAKLHVKKDKLQDFFDSIEEYKNPNNPNQYDANAHRLDYCIQDVKILREGYLLFEEWIKEDYQEELDYTVSIPQIAYNNLYSKGVFENVYSCSGIGQAYLKKFIRGGRCATGWGQKYIVSEIADLDANSLYPSAKCRPDFVIPQGLPTLLTPDEINQFDSIKDSFNYYYVTILVTEVGKLRAFPCIPRSKDASIYPDIKIETIDNDGIFTNYPHPYKPIYADKVTLEDMIKYQNIKYIVLGGIVFNGANNNYKAKAIMEELFKQRLKLKALKLQSQQIPKLISNASYGRMILKAIETIEIWISDIQKQNKDKYNTYIERHYEQIKVIEELDSKACITKYKSIKGHKNYSHVGCNVLSVSKRIMHEVIYLAEDNGIAIFMIDTDSMHLYNRDIPRLEELFRNEYGRELYGKNLHQFSTDFEIPKALEKTHTNPIAELSIIVGKKTYLDVLRLEPINSNTHKIEYCNVVRAKGITKGGLDEFEDKINLYLRLYLGESIKFDMLADNGCSFEFGKGVVTSKIEFIRKLKFNTGEKLSDELARSRVSDKYNDALETYLMSLIKID